VELAVADDAFLHVLVVINAPQQQMKRGVIKKPAAAVAVARPEARHADQPLDLSLLHCGDEHSRRFGEKSRRLEDGFEPVRNAERLNDDVSSGQRALHRGEPERVPGHFLQFGVVKTNSSGCPRQRTYGMPCREGGLHGLKPDPSARADDQNCRHGVMLPVGSAWLSVMCDAGSRTARWVDGLKRAFRAVVVARGATYVAAKLASEGIAAGNGHRGTSHKCR